MISIDELFDTIDTPESDQVVMTIDEDLRVVSIPDLALVVGAEGDKNVNRIYFKMNRYYRGTDLASFAPRINYVSAAGNYYFYDSVDLEIGTDSLIFSWIIRDTVAEASGDVEFSVCLRQCIGDKLLAEFNTAATTLKCLRSIRKTDSQSDNENSGAIAILDTAVLDVSTLR